MYGFHLYPYLEHIVENIKYVCSKERKGNHESSGFQKVKLFIAFKPLPYTKVPDHKIFVTFISILKIFAIEL